MKTVYISPSKNLHYCYYYRKTGKSYNCWNFEYLVKLANTFLIHNAAVLLQHLVLEKTPEFGIQLLTTINSLRLIINLEWIQNRMDLESIQCYCTNSHCLTLYKNLYYVAIRKSIKNASQQVTNDHLWIRLNKLIMCFPLHLKNANTKCGNLFLFLFLG